MGRPPLPLGTSGKVLFATLPNGRVKARVKFRDSTGGSGWSPRWARRGQQPSGR